MKQILSSKILRKMLILSCLIAGLVFVVSSSNVQPVSAAPCCWECQPNYESCASDCNGNSSCLATCNSLRNSCNRHCVMECEYGGGPCVADYDCPAYVGCNPICIGGVCGCE